MMGQFRPCLAVKIDWDVTDGIMVAIWSKHWCSMAMDAICGGRKFIIVATAYSVKVGTVGWLLVMHCEPGLR